MILHTIWRIGALVTLGLLNVGCFLNIRHAEETLRVTALTKHSARQGPVQNQVATPQSPIVLKVLTYNVQFRPALADILEPRWPNTRARAEAIGRAIACYDVIALQEVFRADRLNEIVQAAEHAGVHCGHGSRLPSGAIFAVATGPRVHPTVNYFPLTTVEWALKSIYNLADRWLTYNKRATPVTDSGIILLSRYPIVAVDTHAFRSRRGFDGWARKGALHVVLRVGHGGTTKDMDVFVTHLQAARHRRTRLAQVQELARFMSRRCSVSVPNPVLVLGDFNIDGDVHHWQHDYSEYNQLKTALQNVVPGLVDVWSELWEDTPGFTNARRNRRIDYIFASVGRGLVTQSVHIQEFRTVATPVLIDTALSVEPVSAISNYSTLSDHAGVEAAFLWKP